MLKSGIRKDVTASVNKELMNKSSSKNVFLRFQLFTLLHVSLAAYRGIFTTQSKCLALLSFKYSRKKNSIADAQLGWKYASDLRKYLRRSFLKKNNTTGTDSAVLSLDFLFFNFWMKRNIQSWPSKQMQPQGN